ncbi:MAG: PDZ domain-containing protein [Pirellulales bacterium]
MASAATLGGKGVRVLEAPAGSAAAKAGLQPGDVILKLNGKTTANVRSLLRLYAAAKGKKVERSPRKTRRGLGVGE